MRAIESMVGSGDRWPVRNWLALLLMVCGLSAGLHAQGPVDAGLRGRVLPPRGGAAATVRLRVLPKLSPSEGAGPFEGEHEVPVASDGSFAVLRLAPGIYRLEASGVAGAGGAIGRAAATAEAEVTLEAGELRDVVLQLLPAGGPPQAGAVQRTPLALGAPDMGLSDVMLDALPLAELTEAEELSSESHPAAMTEAASGDAGDDAAQRDSEANDAGQRGSAGEDAASGLTYMGLPSTQATATLDGLSLEQKFRGGARGAAGSGPSAGSSFARDAVSRLRVRRGAFSEQAFSAKNGGGGGGYAAVSRGAPSALHGGGFIKLRTSALAAANPFSIETHYRDGTVTSAAVKPAGTLVQFGGSLGAPLQSLFGDKGGQRVAPRWRQAGIFATVEASVRDDHLVATPAQSSFFSLSAEQRALLGTRGVSTVATNTALDYLDSLTGTLARKAERLQGFVRADAEPRRGDRLSIAYLDTRYSAPAGATFGQASDAVVARGLGSVGDAHVAVDAGTLRWLHVFRPRLNNELRGQIAHDLEYETARPSLPQEPAIGPGGLAPQISIGPDGFAFGTPASLGRTAYPEEDRVQLADTVQFRVGRHLLSFGVDWSRVDDRIASLANTEGSFNYESGTINGHDGGLVDWITDATFNVNAYPNGGCPSITAATHLFCFRSFTQSFGSTQTRFTMHDFAGFAEDALQPFKGVTVTIGMRYDYTLLPVPQQPNALLDAGLASLVAPSGLPGHGYTNVFPEDRNNLGPRVSLAWAPLLGHAGVRPLTVHVGYGVFYGRIPGAMVQAALTDNDLASGALHIRITPATVTQCPQVMGVSQGFGYPCAYTSTPPAAVQQTSSALVFDSRFRAPMVQRGSLSVEAALPSRIVSRVLLRASYAVAIAHQLPATTDLNIAPSAVTASFQLQGGDGRPGLYSGETFAVPLYTARSLTTYGPVTALVSNANATYHAATLEASWMGGVGAFGKLSLRGSYTVSKALDDAPMGSAVPSLDTQFDPRRDGYDKGRSAQDFPQRFAGTLEWTLGSPGRGRAKRPLSDLHKLVSGWRVAAVGVEGSGAPYSYKIFGGSRLSGGRESINGSGGATYLPTIGRNTLRLPVRGRVDLRLSRELHLHGATGLQVDADAFNLLNSVNVSSVQTRAFLPGDPPAAGGLTPLVFQSAAAISAEGLTTLPFGAPTSSTTGLSRERQIEVGVRLRF